MKKYLLAAAFTGVFATCFAQNIESAATSAIVELRQNHEEALDRLLLKYLKNGDVGAVAEISRELKKLRPSSPKIESGKPPVGWWRWNSNYTVSIDSNGLTTWNDKSYGIWRWLDEKAGKGEVRWDSGYIDTFIVSPDGRNLHIVNNLDAKYVASRIDRKD